MTDRTTPRTVLLRHGRILSPTVPGATALAVTGDRVSWIGREPVAEDVAATADRIVDLAGALVTPAFTDAHVHLTATGLTLTGLDLADAGSLAEALARVAAYASAPGHAADAVLLGQGWDAARWPERRPPSRAELDRAAGGRPVYLSRVDAHSALASTALLDRVAGVTRLSGYHPEQPLTGAAHHAVRRAAHGTLAPAQRAAAQRAALRRAAALGIGSLHECAGPEISSEEDLVGLLALADAEPGPRVVGFWAELVTNAKDAKRIRELGAAGAAGDLFADGSLGSHTAHLHTRYADADTRGTGYLTADETAAHLTACTEAGLRAGFHAIGDAAVDAVAAGARAAADRLGALRLRAARHRVEHAELIGPDAVAAFAELGLTASVQPAFDAAWGGPDGMYAERLGPERAAALNPYAALLRAGVPLAFGSDAPVTPLDPWGTVRAAVEHRTPGHRITWEEAFAAHTRGGWRAVGRDDGGVLEPGAPADYAVWAAPAPGPDAPWPPAREPGGQPPRCLRTVVAGRTVYDHEGDPLNE